MFYQNKFKLLQKDIFLYKVMISELCRGSSVVERMPGSSGLSRVIGIENQVNSGETF